MIDSRERQAMTVCSGGPARMDTMEAEGIDACDGEDNVDTDAGGCEIVVNIP